MWPQGRPLFLHCLPRACLEIRKGAVFVPKSVWLGETREHTPRGSATGEQQRRTGLGAKTFRRRPLGYGGTSQAAALLPLGFVVAVVTARYRDAPTTPPRPRPKSPIAAPLPIFKQALSLGLGINLSGGNCCLCRFHIGAISPYILVDRPQIEAEAHGRPPRKASDMKSTRRGREHF